MIPLEEHAEKLSDLTGYPVHYIDDVCGPAAIEAVKNLPAGEAIILGNLRYLGEELSTFSNFVKLKPEDMGTVWHIRKLSPLFDLYVNDAFSAAHRDAPSMVGFPHFLPAAAGFQFFDEYAALASVKGRCGTSVHVRTRRRKDFRCLRHDGICPQKWYCGQNFDYRRHRHHHAHRQTV